MVLFQGHKQRKQKTNWSKWTLKPMLSAARVWTCGLLHQLAWVKMRPFLIVFEEMLSVKDTCSTPAQEFRMIWACAEDLWAPRGLRGYSVKSSYCPSEETDSKGGGEVRLVEYWKVGTSPWTDLKGEQWTQSNHPGQPCRCVSKPQGKKL